VRAIAKEGTSLGRILFQGADPSTRLVGLTINFPIEYCPPWLREHEIEAELTDAAWKRLAELWKRYPKAGQLLARHGVPPKVRSAAGRRLLATRGGKATAAKMRPLGYPNLAKAREVLRRKAVERHTVEATQ
jgi:hypothetical protein